ncbi:MAG: diacylglycerol kinase [Gammaproteobacteria bacterium]|nr:diacylglycerol kinase [Gammaproteobacteria bacterium]
MATDSDNRGIRRLIKAAGFSFNGLAAAFRHETAFKQEVALSLLLIPLALWLGENGVEQALLIMSWLLVLMFELVNSGIEAVVDRVGTEHHELSGRAKDVGSAAVLVALVNAAVVWLLVLTNFF